MKIVRFIFPFLYVRNWHSGAWEISVVRCVLFGGLVALLLLGLLMVYVLQAPVTYIAEV